MKQILFTIAIVGSLSLSFRGFAQYSPPDGTALEDIIVEVYYVSDENDATDEDGGFLDTCSVTYRVFADLKPDYEVQAVYGNENNLLSITTENVFFNNEDRGEETGDAIGGGDLGDNTVALDSYVTVGSASDEHLGVLKSADTDGSIVGGDNNDGGSEGIDGGLLVNDASYVGTPLITADGLISADGDSPSVTLVGIDGSIGVFGDENDGNTFETNGGAWSSLDGVVGPDEENIVLIGQFTAQGEFSFNFNLQIGIPEDLQCTHPDCHEVIQYVAVLSAEESTPGVENDNIFAFDALSFTAEPIICNFTSVEETASAFGFELFPNPVEDVVRMNINTQIIEPLNINVYNAMGVLCKTEQISPAASQFVHELRLSELSSGIYTVMIQWNDEIATKQLIKK